MKLIVLDVFILAILPWISARTSGVTACPVLTSIYRAFSHSAASSAFVSFKNENPLALYAEDDLIVSQGEIKNARAEETKTILAISKYFLFITII